MKYKIITQNSLSDVNETLMLNDDVTAKLALDWLVEDEKKNQPFRGSTWMSFGRILTFDSEIIDQVMISRFF